MAETHDLILSVRVYDRAALHAAALKHALTVDGADEATARELLADTGEDDGIDVGACLQMIFDPGVSPDGCEIEESRCEFRMADEADDDSDDLTPAHDLPRPNGAVAITLHKPGATADELVERFATIADAESYLSLSAGIDPDDLAAGHYGIDAPHGVGSDNEAIALARRLKLLDASGGDATAAHAALSTVDPDSVRP